MAKKSPIKKKKNESLSSIEKKNEELNKEIELEHTKPGKIIKDEMRLDEKFPEYEKDQEEDMGRKSSTFLFIFLGAIVAIFIILIIGLRFGSELLPESMQDEYTYNGFTFTKGADGNWHTSFRLENRIFPIPFQYGPRDLETIPVSIPREEILTSDYIYLVLPPMNEVDTVDGRRLGIAAVEVGKIIGTKNGIYNIPARAAVSALPTDATENETRNTPVVNCSSASENITVIMFGFGDTTSVYEAVPNCYAVQGQTGQDVVKAADALVYNLVGIMK